VNKNKKNNILFLSSWFPSRINPTNGNFVQKHIEALADFINAFVIQVVFDRNITKKEISIFKSKNVNYYIVYLPSSNKTLKLFWPIIKFFKIINEYNNGYKYFSKDNKISLIHGNILYPIGIIVLYFHYKYKLKYVFSEHWSAYAPLDPEQVKGLKMFISKLIAKNAEYIFPVSINLMESMQKKGIISKYKVVPNVVETEMFKPITQSKVDISVKQILHISTLDDVSKNFTGILNVLGKLLKHRNDFCLNVISESEIEKFSESIERNALNENIKFYGYCEPVKVAEIMRQSSFMLMFSNFENLPCVIIEAMASGIPVIATNVGGIPELINESNGLMVSPQNEEELLNAVNYMLDNFDRYNKEEMHNFACLHFSNQSVSEKILKVYNEVITLAKHV